MQSLLLGFLLCYGLSDALVPPATAALGAQQTAVNMLPSSRRAWASSAVAALTVPLYPTLAVAAENDDMDALTRELLARTEKNRAANAAAVASRQGLEVIPFGGVGQAPGVDAARLNSPRLPTADAAEATAADSSAAIQTPRFRVEPYDAAADARAFHSQAFGKEEYNNAFAASENTNVSPKEAYDTILSKVAPKELEVASTGRPLRALDLGAGAGVSTEVRPGHSP